MEDYEKKYKETLNRAREIHRNEDEKRSDMEWLFPELKESEDEKIRKALIKGVESCKASGWTNFGNNVDIDVVLAWLKEQGKQKPIDYNKELKKCRENPLYFFDKYVKLEKQKPACSEEDERIRKALVRFHKSTIDIDGIKGADILAWLEKQGQTFTKKDVDDAYLKGIIDAKNELEKQGTPAKLSEEEQNSFAKGVLTSCAESFIKYLDAHKYEGKMCVSNGECEDIENAFHNAMWDRLHRYYCKYIEKQGKQKTAVTDFNAKDWYVSKVDGKIHDMTYNPADKVEPIFSIGDVLCDKSCTTLNKNSQPNIEILDIRDGMYICNNCSFPISQQDEYELVAKKIEDEIEIPFGAKDSELQEATYYIPDGFHAEIDDDKVVIKKGEKPAAWSDEDEEMAEDLIKGCVSVEKAHHFIHTPKEVADWLKSLKDRIICKNII